MAYGLAFMASNLWPMRQKRHFRGSQYPRRNCIRACDVKASLHLMPADSNRPTIEFLSGLNPIRISTARSCITVSPSQSPRAYINGTATFIISSETEPRPKADGVQAEGDAKL